MSGSSYIAVDLGAESGRVMRGTLDERGVTLHEAHRFANVHVRTPDGLFWDALRLYNDILTGLRAAGAAHGAPIAGIGVDSWGVDYGLLDAAGRLLGNPYHYRDARTDGLPEVVARRVPAAEQYARTGIAQLPFNTLYQLMSTVRCGDRRLELATSLLLMPDLMHYWLSGERAIEYTNASTSGALSVEGAWATDLLARLDIPSHMLLAPVAPGTRLGPLRVAVREECGLGAVEVIAPATHDTACAVAAVPAAPAGPDGAHAYISSGTWSLCGLELDHPINTEEARRAGFTNEGGVGATYRFLTNIMGLWLVQECRRAWARAGITWSYEELTARAAAVPSPGVVIDVNDPDLLHPADMPATLLAQLRRNGHAAPAEPAALARAVFEGLALKYRATVEQAERLSGTRVRVVHIVGGGCRNELLCQLTADACGRPVLAGPVEATALGNVLVQALGRGEVADLAAAHALSRASITPREYEPRDTARWDEMHARLQSLSGAAIAGG